MIRRRLLLNGMWTLKWDGYEEKRYVPYSRPPVGVTICEKPFFYPEWQGIVRLCFDGIVNEAEVKLNGKTLGRHWAFTPFWFDITPLVKHSDINKLEVKLYDRLGEDTVPTGAVCWSHNGGIIRDVYVECCSNPFIENFFLQQFFKDGFKRVDCVLKVRLYGKGGKKVSVRGSVEDEEETLKEVEGEVRVDGHVETTLRFSLSGIELWSPENPRLYELKVHILDNGEEIDSLKSKIGFREFKTDGNRFKLNGRKIFLKGVCRHDFYNGDSFVVDKHIVEEDLRAIKEMNANYVRLVHYPPHPMVPAMADEIGLLVSEEIPAWADTRKPKIVKTCLSMLKELVERDYNHPSIVMWFTGNAAQPERGSDPNLIAYNQKAVALVKNLDPTRIVSYVNDNDLHDVEGVKEDVSLLRKTGLQVYCKNAYWSKEELDEAAQAFPADLPTLITEWGVIGSNRTDVLSQRFTEDVQAQLISEYFKSGLSSYFPNKKPKNVISGVCYWAWTDTPWPDLEKDADIKIIAEVAKRFDLYLNFATGLLYLDRVKKKAYYVMKQLYGSTPNYM